MDRLVILDADWVSPGSPIGWFSAFLWFKTTNPEAFDLLDDPLVDLQADIDELTYQMVRHGLRPYEVAAPPALQRRGALTVEAFPAAVLKLVLG